MIERFFPPKISTGNAENDVRQASFWEYLKSKEFLLSVAILFGGGLLLLVLTLTVLLPVITRHNDQTEVPDITGLPLRKAIDLLNEKGLEYEVSDSVYKPDLKPLTVDHQDPGALSIVKPGRTVFLRVNKVQPPMVKLPNIFEESMEHARDILLNWKLRVGNVTYVPSSFNNLVIGAYYKGQALKKDTPVPEGAKIDLKVSSWNVTPKIPVPELVGKDFQDALNEITALGLIPNPVFIASGEAENPMEVYRQDPKRRNKTDSITVGSTVTIFVNNDGPPSFTDGGKKLKFGDADADADADADKNEDKPDKKDEPKKASDKKKDKKKD
jgi:beta-lactam-binding protein with PASTA domain